MDLRWRVAGTLDLLAFARRAYRTPTFNELNYPGFGNPNLDAEDACLTDIGLEYTLPFRGNWRLRAKADAFFNCLKDKIVSAPTADNPSIWLPYNVGVVQMAGTDFDTLDITFGKDFKKPGISLKLIARNLTDSRYELAGGYPMPGRAFYSEILFKF